MKQRAKLVSFLLSAAVLAGAWLTADRMEGQTAAAGPAPEVTPTPIPLAVGTREELTALSWSWEGETVNLIRRYHFTIGFWGTNGADLETGFTTPEFSEAAVKQLSLEHTVRPYVLADSSKFSKISLITFAEFMDATVVTDRLPDDEGAYRSAGNIVEVEEQQ